MAERRNGSSNHIRIDTDSIPQSVADSLAVATMALIRELQSTPEGRAAIETELAIMEAEKKGGVKTA